MKPSECTNQELVVTAKTAFHSLKEALLALVSTSGDVELVKNAKAAILELEKRERQKLNAYRNVEFKHVEKVNDKVYLIEVDCGAVDATDVIQVRLEKYETEEALENGFDYQLISISDSIDEAVIALDKIKRGKK